MNSKLESLRDKLSDLSKGNRSLRLLKIYDKWSFDLSNLDGIKDAKHSETSEILKKILNRSKTVYLVSNQSLDNQAIMASHRLSMLYRNINAIKEESGLYSFYVGYPFITGKLIDGTYIQAPIFLFPVQLDKRKERKPGWILNVLSEEESLINRTLLLAFQKYNGTFIDENILEEANEILSERFDEWVCELLNKYGVNCTFKKGPVAPIQQYTQKEIPDLTPGSFEIMPYMILGSFPQGNSSLLKDYDELLEIAKDGGEFGLLNELLLEEEVEEVEGQWDGVQKIDIDAMPEKENFFITDLDASQEEVILSVGKTKGLVVHGPPGTGKSQVIVNLISNAIAKDHKVLVVCQKRAALDVVYQRLDAVSLAEQVALVHDPVNDRKSLYGKLKHILDERYLSTLESNLESYSRLSDEVQEKTQYFNKIAKALWSKQPCGFSAYELYANSKMPTVDDVILNLGELPLRVNKEKLLKTLVTMNYLGNCFSRYGHNYYPWVKRQSFANMVNSDLYDLLQKLNKAINWVEVVQEFNFSLFNKDFSLEYCWNNYNVIQNGLKKIRSFRNNKSLVNSLSLYFWFWINGRQIKEYLSSEVSIRSFDPDTTEQIEQCLVQLNKYGKDTRGLYESICDLHKYLNSDGIESLQQSVKSRAFLLEILKRLKTDLEQDFNYLVEMDNKLEQLDDLDSKLLSILKRELPVTADNKLGTIWENVLEKSFYTKWIDNVENQYPELKNISTSKYNEMLDMYKSLLQQKLTLTPSFLRANLLQKIHFIYQKRPKVYKDLKYQVGKMRKVWPVRKLVEKYWSQGLLDIMPVWLVSPETVSAVFPFEKEMFDLIIFDEASQCSVENGIPACYRAKSVVIAGDEKQLPPFDLFKVSSGVSDDGSDYSDDVYDSDSLLNLAKRCYPTKLLGWHYRSQYEELINYSNHAFYGGEVEIAPNVRPYADPPAIEWISVNGRWENQCNQEEAKELCVILKKTFKEHPGKSVGVITFNKKQQDLIWGCIEEMAEQDLEFNGLYTEVMSRDIDERLFVKNIENVQGDERDIIIFSIAYGKNVQGRVSLNLGALNRLGGENRLNVAITRAKERIIIICSVKPSEFNVTDSKNLGPKLFKNYLEYAYAVSNKEHDTVIKVLKEVNTSIQVRNNNERPSPFDSPFEQEVYNYLEQRGYKIQNQVGCSGYRIDMAIIHPHDPTRYILGIECDGAMFHSARSARERDIYRQRFLESKGWHIARIWSRNWWQNPAKEIQKVEKLIEALCNE